MRHASECLALAMLWSLLPVAALSCNAREASVQVKAPESDFASSYNRRTERGWIGIRLDGDAKDPSRVFVKGTVPGSPAASAGLHVGDRLVRMDDQPVDDARTFVEMVRAKPPQSTLRLLVNRGTENLQVDVQVEKSPDENALLERILIGQVAPPLRGLVGVDGAPVSDWQTRRGQVVLLDFWAPWCGICHVVAQDLNRWHEKFDHRLTILGVAAAPVEDVIAQAPKFHMAYATAVDPTEAVSRAYEAVAVPLLVLVDANGVVRAVTLGYSSQRMNEMEKLIEVLVSAP